MRVDLVEPFYGGSHRAWADGWRAHSRHEIRLSTLPANSWRWRMRGAAVTLGTELLERASGPDAPELIVASDMIDLATLAALTRRTFAAIPLVLYLHENQLTYPRQPGEGLDRGLAWTTWNNLLVADEVWFNSAVHREELFTALESFLDDVPDHSHRPLLESARAETAVLPVGVELSDLDADRSFPPAPPLILSNQRWHHDKDVAAVVRALIRMADEGHDFRVAVIGEEQGGEAATIGPLLDRLGVRVVARGWQPRARYVEMLAEAAIVVSAARNKFFGIGVVEAVASGAIPVLPAALAYPET
ncbi:MAG: tRNA-queuosine alpha-mannosyltransferase domain-containing protein, partial [Ilumatobacteraceae bacterium]